MTEFKIRGKELIIREPTLQGNGAMVYIPKAWLGEPVAIIRGVEDPMPTSLSIKALQTIAEEHGGKCLSDEYIGSHTKLKWTCKEGHEWEATASQIKKGTWCPRCGDNP